MICDTNDLDENCVAQVSAGFSLSLQERAVRLLLLHFADGDAKMLLATMLFTYTVRHGELVLPPFYWRAANYVPDIT